MLDAAADFQYREMHNRLRFAHYRRLRFPLPLVVDAGTRWMTVEVLLQLRLLLTQG